ncbi:MAG TPA: EAL domain-containing protein [Actinobacteria bacterium]|nr:EAL domain-containing protein [Actinomycetota bacterium]
MNLVPAIALIGAIVIALVGNFIYYQNIKAPLNRVFALMAAVWSISLFGSFMALQTNNFATALWWLSWNIFFWIFALSLRAHFVLIFVFGAELKKWIIQTLYVSTFLAFLLATVAIPVKTVKGPYGYTFNIQASSSLVALSSWAFVVGVVPVILLVYYFLKATDRKKWEAVLLGIALLLSITTTLFDALMRQFSQSIIETAAFGQTVSVALIAYAMWKYELHILSPTASASSVLTTMADSLILADPQGRILDVNTATINLLGYRKELIINKKINMIIDDDLVAKIFPIPPANVPTSTSYDTSYRTIEGHIVPVILSVTTIKDRAGSPAGLVLVGKDMTEQKKAEAVSLMESTIESTADGILVMDFLGQVILLNEQLKQMWQFPPNILSAKNEKWIFKHILEQVKGAGVFARTVESVHQEPETKSFDTLELVDGRIIESYSIPRRFEDKLMGRVWNFRDITNRRKAEKAIEYLAYYDDLTGLPNRHLLKDRLIQALRFAEEHKEILALIDLDLDHFKLVNDALGRDIGDQWLRAVAKRTTEQTQKTATIARVGPDEFTILLPGLDRPEDAREIAQNILKALSKPFSLMDQEITGTASVGICFHPFDGNNAEVLLGNAGVAMHRAKKEGGNSYQFFEPSMNAEIIERLTSENNLNRALAKNEFVLYYQPFIDVKNEKIVGAEALIRWHDPQKGLTLPDDFLDLAEETGLMPALGGWVIRTACQQNKAWQDAGFNLRISVNLSNSQLKDPGFVSLVKQILMETQLDPHLLELELTETIIMENVEEIAVILFELKELGVAMAVDDFGTGYSSLSSLKLYPVDTLKIDKSFISDMTISPDSAAIVTATLSLARSLNLRVIAEGVETEDQFKSLRAGRCELVQGYYFNPPLPAEKFEQLLSSDHGAQKAA